MILDRKIPSLFVVLLFVSLHLAILQASEFPLNLSKPLSLDDCIAIALRNNPGVIQAQNGVSSADAGVMVSASPLLPQVSARSGWTRSGPATTARLSPLGQLYTEEGGYQDSYNTSFSLSQSLFNIGAWAQVSQAQRSKEISVSVLEATKAKVVLEVAQDYYGILKAQKLVEVQTTALAQSQEQLKRVEAMYALGSARKSDLLKSKVNLAERELDLITAQNGVKLAQGSLSYALGLEVTLPLEVVEDLSVKSDSFSLDESLRVAYLHRPEMAQVQADISKARATIWSARSRWVPTFSASASYSSYGNEFPRSLEAWKQNDSWTIGLSASVDLFDGFGRWGNLKEAQANLRIAEWVGKQTKLQIALEVKQAYLNYEAAREKVVVSQRGVESAEEDYRLTSEQYRLGSATMLDLLTSQVSLTQAKVNQVQALYDYKVTRAELERAVGKKVA